MTDSRTVKGDVLAIGDLPRELVSQVEAKSSRLVMPTRLAALSEDILRARLLLVGSGLDAVELASVLTNVRESAPSLLVWKIELPDVPCTIGIGDESDAVFRWPRDQEQLLSEIDVALRGDSLTHSVLSRMASPVLSIAAGISLVLAWQHVTSAGFLPLYILPAPDRVGAAFIDRWDYFLFHAGVTTAEALAGFLVGNAIGIAIAILLFRFGWLRRASLPVLVGFQAVPLIAIAPLLVIWLGSGMVAKATMAAIICVFPVVSNLLSAFSAIDRDLSQLFIFHRASYWSTLSKLMVPASYPAILSGLRISGGLAVVGAIVAEFTGADRGLGYLLLNASYRLETETLFVAILLSAALGVIFATLPNLLKVSGIGRTYAWKSGFGARP